MRNKGRPLKEFSGYEGTPARFQSHGGISKLSSQSVFSLPTEPCVSHLAVITHWQRFFFLGPYQVSILRSSLNCLSNSVQLSVRRAYYSVSASLDKTLAFSLHCQIVVINTDPASLPAPSCGSPKGGMPHGFFSHGFAICQQ